MTSAAWLLTPIFNCFANVADRGMNPDLEQNITMANPMAANSNHVTANDDFTRRTACAQFTRDEKYGESRSAFRLPFRLPFLSAALALSSLIVVTGCANVAPGAPAAATQQPATNSVSGTARLQERTILPANSILETSLEEIASNGSAVSVLGTDTRAAPGLSSITFSIPFADSQVRPGRRYAVRARVMVNGQLIFVSSQAAPVLSSPQDKTVAIALQRPSALQTPSVVAATPPAAARASGSAAASALTSPAARGADSRIDAQASRREAQARAQALAQARAQAQADREQAEAQTRAQTRARAEAQTQAQALAQAKAQAEAQAVAEAQARARAQSEAETRARAEAQARAETEALARAEAERQAQAKAQAEAQAVAEAQARARAQSEAETRARAEAQARAETEARARAEAERQAQAKAQAEAQAEAQAAAEAQARARAQAEAETRARVEAQALATAQAQAKAEEDARARAQAAAQLQAQATTTPAPAPAPAPAPVQVPQVVAAATPAAPRAPAPARNATAPISTQTGIFRGLYRLTADVSTFEDCASGARLPVSRENEYFALEGAYVRLFSSGGGDPAVLATVSGRVLPRSVPENAAQRNTLVVDGFLSLGGDACPSARSAPVAATPPAPVALENTRWKLELLNQNPVEAIEKAREPYLVFQSASKHATGSGSCNQLLVPYVRDGDALKFTDGTATARTCPTGMQQEAALLAALADTARFNLEGRTLRLLDGQGRPLAQLRAEEI